MLGIVVALLLSFVGVVLLAPVYIGLLQRLGFGKQIRSEGPQGHLVKAGTPTMGGMLMVLVVMFLAMAMRIEDVFTLTPMLALVGVGILGAIDDFVNARTGIGMRGRYKLIWQTGVGLLAAFYIQRHYHITALNIPGLASGDRARAVRPVRRLHHRGRQQRGEPDRWARRARRWRADLQLRRLSAHRARRCPRPEEQPAQPGHLLRPDHRRADGLPLVQRPSRADLHGRRGALGLGATLAVVATITGQLPLLAVIGVVFVAVTLSVILQVGSFKLRGRRIFRMAPLHHHFELIGWAEEKITVRFWIVSALAGLLGFSLFLATVNAL